MERNYDWDWPQFATVDYVCSSSLDSDERSTCRLEPMREESWATYESWKRSKRHQKEVCVALFLKSKQRMIDTNTYYSLIATPYSVVVALELR